ncbi:MULTISPECIES: phage baseplate protein [Vibrio]|uniref:phage baseplate protein n=1 Tax=Vibrio TaxID=662 RepID=UPI000B8E2E75|nr:MULTISPECIES: phage baseplate protein [Vibrio]MBY7667265.1 phage baseplate protein [Vibrio anguillarum]NAX44237.1 phage baseplate protein [Vibrio sp. V25_P4S6T154]OXX41848.1 phage baseplate protein [Vibrio sp. V17_P4S1T151]OXX60707.1 phage baseplate protein [Vibrio sp. V15_P4S5T153]OXX63231.1 phage baseplate protein [Vibrio sp. V20_P4S3T152]
MIAINQETGLTVTGLEALGCRVKRVLTTQVGSRIKRRTFGNRAIERLGKNQSPSEGMIVQNLSIAALTDANNQLVGLVIEQCQAIPTARGFLVTVVGKWNGESIRTSVTI